MSTYLQLVNRARIECSASGAATALTTFSGVSLENQRIINWVNDAWRDIQQHKPDWDWMRKTFSVPLSAATQTYSLTTLALTDLAEWKRDSARCYNTATGTGDEQILPFMEWETWRNVYQFGAMRSTQGRPAAFSITPQDKSLVIGPVPDNSYTMVGEYYRIPNDIANAGDDLTAAAYNLPERYHMLLVYLTMQKYATWYAAPEVMSAGQALAEPYWRKLEMEYLPIPTWGPPLA
jgi:hypothetical protein